jgi:transcriptional regulator with XRE-family HTH domain
MPETHIPRQDANSRKEHTAGMDEDAIAVGTAIRRLRTAAGATQAALGLALGLDQSGVSKLEKGRPQATVTQIRLAEEFLGLPRGSVLREAGLVEDGTEIASLAGKLGRLPERDRRAVERIIDGYLEQP